MAPGGTSKGEGDLNYRVVAELDPGILVHGVALKPGKPICLAAQQGKPCGLQLQGQVGAQEVHHLRCHQWHCARIGTRHLDQPGHCALDRGPGAIDTAQFSNHAAPIIQFDFELASRLDMTHRRDINLKFIRVLWLDSDFAVPDSLNFAGYAIAIFENQDIGICRRVKKQVREQKAE